VRVPFGTGRAEDPAEEPLSAAESAAEHSPRPLHQGAFPASGDPGQSSAERTLAAAVDAVRRQVDRAKELHVGAKDRAGEVVLRRRPVARPVDEQPGPGGRRQILLPGPGVFGESLRAVFDRVAEERRDLIGESVGVFVEAPRQRLLGVAGLQGAGRTSLDAVESGGEEQRFPRGRGLPRQRLCSRRTTLEFRNEFRPASRGEDGGRASSR
jgi:hypothetical protein